MANELVAMKVDVLVTYVTQASLVAKKATSSIPIVMVGVGDPVGVGLIASLAHPGGNVTGTSSIAPTVAAKQLDLLKVIIAALWNPANIEFQTLQVNQAKTAARAAGVDLQLFEARAADQFEAAHWRGPQWRSGGIAGAGPAPGATRLAALEQWRHEFHA